LATETTRVVPHSLSTHLSVGTQVSMYAVATDLWSQPSLAGPLSVARNGGAAVAALNALLLIGTGGTAAVDRCGSSRTFN
jgi:hypothetical protein